MNDVKTSTEPGQAAYTPFILTIYDWWVFRVCCNNVWMCPPARLQAFYDQHYSANHLDVGVGTGYFLRGGKFPVERPSITLFDLNENSLNFAANQIESYAPKRVKGDILGDSVDLPQRAFSSVGLGFLFHCLPEGGQGKWRALDHLAPTLESDGVLFGSTILGEPTPPLARQRWLTNAYNRRGIFSNTTDSVDRLRTELSHRFEDVQVDTEGLIALFSARQPKQDA